MHALNFLITFEGHEIMEMQHQKCFVSECNLYQKAPLISNAQVFDCCSAVASRIKRSYFELHAFYMYNLNGLDLQNTFELWIWFLV